jgi:hypothetical protein
MLMFLASVLDQIDPALEHIQKGSVHDARLAWLQECLVSETGRKYLNDLSEARSGHSVYRWSRLASSVERPNSTARFNGVIESCAGSAERLTKRLTPCQTAAFGPGAHG